MIQVFLKFIASLLLRCIDPTKAKGKRFYEAIAPHSQSVAFEAVCVKEDASGQRFVWLGLRKPGQSYEGLWSLAGTIFRPKDTQASAMKRIQREDLQHCGITSYRPARVPPFFWKEQRGPMVSIPFLVILNGDPDNGAGQWWPADDLPRKIIPLHKEMIEATLESVSDVSIA